MPSLSVHYPGSLSGHFRVAWTSNFVTSYQGWPHASCTHLGISKWGGRPSCSHQGRRCCGHIPVIPPWWLPLTASAAPWWQSTQWRVGRWGCNMVDFWEGLAPVAEMKPPNAGTSCFSLLLPTTHASDQTWYSWMHLAYTSCFIWGWVNTAPLGILGPSLLEMWTRDRVTGESSFREHVLLCL